MNFPEATAVFHHSITRRFFLHQVGIGLASIGSFRLLATDSPTDEILPQLIAKLNYLTPSDEFRNVERHLPLPYKLPRERRLELGLERETWHLNVIPDPASNSRLRKPLTKKNGTALNFKDLMKLAEKKAARYLKVMTCNNIGNPLGMGLWEGVPLRDVLWLAQPDKNVRRVFYRGYHNEKPDQIFQSSLPIGRILEDLPGEQPVILCYKLNGKPLTGERGGPVRMIVPDAYGFKSIKWIQQIFLTNQYQANDTYAEQNNDIDSKMKTYARFLHCPKTVKNGEPIPITGVAQTGMSGLTKIQYWLHPADDALPKGDRYFTTANWQEAQILTPKKEWGGEFLDNKLPEIPHQIDADGQPKSWPLANTITHWATLIAPVEPGRYQLRCRTIDRNGIAQPMPRPFQKSGGNAIQMEEIEVTKS
jgi:hypothetical protein